MSDAFLSSRPDSSLSNRFSYFNSKICMHYYNILHFFLSSSTPPTSAIHFQHISAASEILKWLHTHKFCSLVDMHNEHNENNLYASTRNACVESIYNRFAKLFARSFRFTILLKQAKKREDGGRKSFNGTSQSSDRVTGAIKNLEKPLFVCRFGSWAGRVRNATYHNLILVWEEAWAIKFSAREVNGP